MAGQQRVEVVDLLRGSALLGILCVNVWFFVPDEGPAHDLTNALFATKSYLLFAALFGYSFVLQRRAAQRAGRPFGPMMRRRLAGLAVLGLLNGLLLFEGDILLPYALLGFLLYRARDLATAAAIRLAVAITIATAGVLGGLGTLVWLAEEAGAAVAADPGPPAGSHAAAYLPTFVWIMTVQAAPAFACMLAGMAAARGDLLERPDALARIWRRITPVAPIVGAAGAVVFMLGMASQRASIELIAFGITTATAPFLTATYVAILIRLHRRWPGSAVLRGVGAAGRLSLTNYLAQSVLLNLVFVWLGLDGPVLAIVLVLFAGQVLLSGWWAGGHRYGPAELVLRRWTYR